METRERDYVDHWVEERLARLSPSTTWDPHMAKNRCRLNEQLGRKREHRSVWMLSAASICLMWFAVAEIPVLRAVAQRCGEWLLASGSQRAPARAALPDLPMTDVQGRPLTLSALQGNVVLLTFWTTSCGQCQTEMSWFSEFQQTYRDRHLVVLGASLDRGGWTQLLEHLAGQPVNYRILLADRD